MAGGETVTLSSNPNSFGGFGGAYNNSSSRNNGGNNGGMTAGLMHQQHHHNQLSSINGRSLYNPSNLSLAPVREILHLFMSFSWFRVRV